VALSPFFLFQHKTHMNELDALVESARAAFAQAATPADLENAKAQYLPSRVASPN